MKAKYLSLAALALMGALASCQSDDDFTVARPDNAVSVNFSVGSLQGTTRSNAVATDDTQREFNQGDQISVSTNDQEAVLFQCTSTENQTWTEAVPNKFLLWTQPMLTFSAYYPATTGTSMTAFTVPTDQSSVDKIALADYMTRQQNISRPEGGSNIQMQLERKMARVIVRISGFGSQYRDEQKTVSNVRIYSEASGIENDNPTGSSTEILPYAQGNGGLNTTYTALVVPGYGDSGARFIQLTDGESSTLEVKGIPELNAGNSYTFNLVVGKNRIEVASVTVQDWTTGEILAGGQAQEQAAPAYTLLSAATTSDYGKVVCAAGHLHDAKTAVPAGCTAVGILGKVTETGHGLILALKNATNQNWNTINGWTSETNYAGTTLKVLPDDAARGTNLTSYTALGETAVSNWAVAQKSDYEAIFTNLGSTKNSGGMTYDNNVNAYITTGVGGTAMSGTYWSATQDEDYDAWYFQGGSWYDDYKTSTYYVRPVLGFGGQAQEQGGASASGPLPAGALGGLFYSDGTWSSTLEDGKTPIGVIAYLDDPNTTDDDEITEKSNGGGHGLVLCLKNAASVIAWSTEKVSKFSGQVVTNVTALKRTENVSGYTNTATLTADAETAAKYPAAKAAKEYTTLAAPTGTTGWFLPSAQQWVKMQTGLGALDESSITWESWFDTNHTAADKWETALQKAGSGNYDSMTAYLYYWSSSEYSANYAVFLDVDATGTGDGYGFKWGNSNKDSKFNNLRVRPVLAF